MVIAIRNCSCCGREFATGVFGFRCENCQDGFAWTSHGRVGKAHPPCRRTSRAPDVANYHELHHEWMKLYNFCPECGADVRHAGKAQAVGRTAQQGEKMGNMKFLWIFGFEWWGSLRPAEMRTAKGDRYVPLFWGIWLRRPTKRAAWHMPPPVIGHPDDVKNDPVAKVNDSATHR